MRRNFHQFVTLDVKLENAEYQSFDSEVRVSVVHLVELVTGMCHSSWHCLCNQYLFWTVNDPRLERHLFQIVIPLSHLLQNFLQIRSLQFRILFVELMNRSLREPK